MSTDPLDPIANFFNLLAAALGDGSFASLVLANPAAHAPAPDLQRVLARSVVLRGERSLSLVYRHETRDITKNHPLKEGLQVLRGLIGAPFRNAHLHLPGQEVQLALSRKGKASLRIGKTARAEGGIGPSMSGSAPASAPAATTATTTASVGGHNREKQRMLSLDRPFLVDLGVTDARHQLIPSMARKWKQINKFVEVFSHAWQASSLSSRDDVHVVDFGCGKGYLTFALHDHLSATLGLNAHVTGVDLKQDMVALCNQAAARLEHPGLRFDHGDVRTHRPGTINVMIALHACDTATDHALHVGITQGADIIMCSPCCHKQIRPQLQSPHPLRPILRHGVHLGQEAEMLTDGLRAMLLEACGYETQVFEFVSLEHTNKNKMIMAVKRSAADEAEAASSVLAQITDIKSFYGIQDQCLETLLKADGKIPA